MGSDADGTGDRCDADQGADPFAGYHRAVNAAPPSLALVTILPGKPAKVQVDVIATPSSQPVKGTAKVTFYNSDGTKKTDGSASLKNGAVQINLPTDFKPGAYTIVAEYKPGDGGGPASTSQAVTWAVPSPVSSSNVDGGTVRVVGWGSRPTGRCWPRSSHRPHRRRCMARHAGPHGLPDQTERAPSPSKSRCCSSGGSTVIPARPSA